MLELVLVLPPNSVITHHTWPQPAHHRWPQSLHHPLAPTHHLLAGITLVLVLVLALSLSLVPVLVLALSLFSTLCTKRWWGCKNFSVISSSLSLALVPLVLETRVNRKKILLLIYSKEAASSYSKVMLHLLVLYHHQPNHGPIIRNFKTSKINYTPIIALSSSKNAPKTINSM